MIVDISNSITWEAEWAKDSKLEVHLLFRVRSKLYSQIKKQQIKRPPQNPNL